MGTCCNAFDQHWILFPWFFSIHVTFTVIVPGAYPEEAKVCKNVLKWQIFELTGWITGKWLKIDGYMLQCVWQVLNPLFIRVIFTWLSQGRTQGRPKCALRWFQKLMHVPLAVAILLVQYLFSSVRICYRLNWVLVSFNHTLIKFS